MEKKIFSVSQIGNLEKSADLLITALNVYNRNDVNKYAIYTFVDCIKANFEDCSESERENGIKILSILSKACQMAAEDLSDV